MQIEPSVVISAIALAVSLVSAYFQWFRVRGPIVSVLNADEQQRAVLRPYEGLPQVTRQYFPEYKEKNPGHAIVRLVFSNSGDRPGFTRLLKVQVENPPSWSEQDQIKASFYTHALIPAGNIATQDVILRNIPPLAFAKELNIAFSIEWGGPNPRIGKYERKGTIDFKMKVTLHPSVDVT